MAIVDIGSILALILFLVLVATLVYYSRKIKRIQQQAEQQTQTMFQQWVQQHSDQLRKQIEQNTQVKFQAELEKWKLEYEKQIRKDALLKSANTILGRIGEEFAPFLIADRYNVNPKDFRHLGSPVDFIAFKGLSDDKEVEIIFFEVKTGNQNLNTNERKVRDAVNAKRVRYEVINFSQVLEETKKRLREEVEREVEES
ncbi:endonuclease [Sulfolobus sp. A20]|uniref:Holliday junction resolvase-like protein n=1 Tax=Sulfolobaceae TaxID=118883 RepID=UPI000845FEAB|nr:MULTISPECIES: Holliday junction resolvase-like protein [unclassified Sulfolobus]TRM76882.1 endonuclease [Sulfolobus sp. A20-N-F8]TRM78247.1 endonuclease [Sulfolobus sp. B5]TRM80522.1 endonuclease [Sulfolobus sp. D5]TRM84568.1 endonuclease [Sulfolobus sp. F3]TRM88170.1 endonuclease [Sulfolobus sp. C3]TRM88877.1 endonuclease [Sulfolobus sp. E3]TRM94901.1 endonuclease [Sulfolobus sp. A20-N-G8]TRN02102.1 endonuclease [Sulfolobus sp. F1]TRN02940.1 endonuclease [Sulfolobus sp. E1]